MYINPLSFYTPTYPSCSLSGAQTSPETPQDEPVLLAYLGTPAPVFFQAAEVAQPSSQACFPENRSADAFVTDRQSKLNEQRGKINNFDAAINLLKTLPQTEQVKKKIRILESQRGESRILLWMFSRDLGAPEPASLLSNALADINAGGSADQWSGWRYNYWRPQLAMILSGELDDPALRGVLEELLPSLRNAQDWQNSDIRLKEKAALGKIYTNLLQGKDELSSLQGENLYRRALLAKSLGEANYLSLLADAKTYISKLAATGDIQNLNQNSQLVKQRKEYIPDLILRVQKELPKHFAWANLLMANILMREAEDLNQSQEILSKLQEAIPYLNNTSPLEGVPALEAKRVLAENLIQQAYMKKNLNEDYLPLFKQALDHLNCILQWENDYQGKIGTAGLRPRWLVNVTTSVKLSRIKLFQVLVGEINRRPDPAVLDLLSQAELLTPQDRAVLEQQQEPTKTQVFQIQGGILEKLSAGLTEAWNTTYIYGANLPVKIVRNEEETDLKLSLAENLARRAFIDKDLRNNADLLGDAKEEFKEILNSSTASPFTRAMANFWMAKILLVEAGDLDTLDEAQEILKKNDQDEDLEAEDYIRAAIGSGKLIGVLLSSAHQTLGDILVAQKDLGGAQAELEEALRIYPQNYEALAGLADVLNWQGNQAEAIQRYDELISLYPHHLIRERAELGKKEAQMRQGENYSGENIGALESTAFDLFRNEPPGSYLITRAIDDLVEAYETNEDTHEKIILIGNILLGKEHKISQDFGNLKATFQTLKERLTINQQLILSNRFQAKLYLKLAEAVSWTKTWNEAGKKWEKRLDEAYEILDGNPPEIPPKLLHLIKSDSELKLRYHLLIAEIRMRQQENIEPLINYSLDGKSLIEVITKDQDPDPNRDSRDPDLVTRGIRDLIEGYTKKHSKNYPEIVNLVRKYISPNPPYETQELAGIHDLFSSRGRELSFYKFKFQIWKSLADALTWDKDQDEEVRYPAALAELVKIEDEIDRSSLPPNLINVIKSQVLRSRGEIYAYEWDGRNYENAIKSFEDCHLSIENLEPSQRSKDANIIRAWAYVWLGDIYRFAPGHQNPDLSRSYYRIAEGITLDPALIPAQSDERPKLLARIYLGLAKLEMLETGEDAALLNNYNDAYNYLQLVNENYERIDNPEPELRDEVEAAFSEVLPKVMPSVTTSVDVTHGSNGTTETRVQLLGEIPLGFGTVYPPLNSLHLLIRGELDHGASDLYAGYLGLKFFPHSSLSLTLDLRLGTFGGTEPTIFYRRQDLSFSFFWWNKYFTLGGAANFGGLYSNPENAGSNSMTTYNLAAMLNLNGFTNNEWLAGLRVGIEYNHFGFFYLGDPRIRDQFGLGARWEADVSSWFKLKANAFFLAYSTSYYDDVLLRDVAAPGVGFDGSFGAEFTLWRYLHLNALYNLQWTPEFTMHIFNLGLGVTF